MNTNCIKIEYPDKLREWKVKNCLEVEYRIVNNQSECVRNNGHIIHEGPMCEGCPYEFEI